MAAENLKRRMKETSPSPTINTESRPSLLPSPTLNSHDDRNRLNNKYTFLVLISFVFSCFK